MMQLRPRRSVSFAGIPRGSIIRRLACIAALAAGISGCGTGYATGATNAKPMVFGEAERDLECPQEDIRVTEALGGVFEAVGCGRTARYRAICEGVKCTVSSEADPLPGWKDRPAPGDPTR